MRHLLCALALTVSLGAFADPDTQTIDLSGTPLLVKMGATVSVALPAELYVHKLFIQADSPSSQPSYVEISAGGDVKGTLYLPAVDPHYVVTIESKTSSLEFHGINGDARILAIKAVVSSDGDPSTFPVGCHSQIGAYSLRLIWLADRLDGYSTYADYGAYLLPIKKTAGVAYAVAEANGDLSGSSRPYYEQLLASLDNADPYFHQMLEVDEAESEVLEALSIREHLRKLLQ
jgi:hypothetical protein